MNDDVAALLGLRAEVIALLHKQTRVLRRLLVVCGGLGLINLYIACLAVLRLHDPAASHGFAWVCIVLNAWGVYLMANSGLGMWHDWRHNRAGALFVLAQIEHALWRAQRPVIEL